MSAMDHVNRMQLKQIFRDNQALFVALGDLSRQKILLLMADTARLSVGEIAALMDITRPTVSHHIKVLRDANLVIEQRVGVRRYYYPSFRDHIGTMKQLVTLLEQLQSEEDKG